MSAKQPASGRRRRRRDAVENRARLLAAAHEAFSERGLTVTLDEVARRAGLAVGTMYRNFPSKAALIEAVFEHRGNQFARIAYEANAHEDSWSGLAYFLEGMNTLMAGDRGLRDVLLSTREGAEGIARTRHEYGPAVEELLARAKADGYLREEIERSDLFLIDVMIDAVRDFTVNVDTEQWRRCMALVLDGLRPRPEQRPLSGRPMSRAALSAAMHDAGRRRTVGRPPR